MYIKDLADKIGVEQEELEQIIKLKGYEVTSIFGMSSIKDDIAKKIEKEIFEEKEQKIKQEKEKRYLTKVLENNKEDWFGKYYIVIKHLYSQGVLFTVQDFIIGNAEDYYDLTSYKLDLILPVYDGYGRIARNGELFNSEYVLFVVYSIKEKNGDEENKKLLLHVFNGENGGFAYIEKDEKKIYEEKMKEMVDKNGKSIIEVYSSLLEPNATSNLIKQVQDELIKQAQKAQAEATGKAIGTALGAAMLGTSAANLGKAVRKFGR